MLVALFALSSAVMANEGKTVSTTSNGKIAMKKAKKARKTKKGKKAKKDAAAPADAAAPGAAPADAAAPAHP